MVSTQRPPIEIRPSSAGDATMAASSVSSASAIGPANGNAISAAAVESQNRAAKEVETTRAGSSSSL